MHFARANNTATAGMVLGLLCLLVALLCVQKGDAMDLFNKLVKKTKSISLRKSSSSGRQKSHSLDIRDYHRKFEPDRYQYPDRTYQSDSPNLTETASSSTRLADRYEQSIAPPVMRRSASTRPNRTPETESTRLGDRYEESIAPPVMRRSTSRNQQQPPVDEASILFDRFAQSPARPTNRRGQSSRFSPPKHLLDNPQKEDTPKKGGSARHIRRGSNASSSIAEESDRDSDRHGHHRSSNKEVVGRPPRRDRGRSPAASSTDDNSDIERTSKTRPTSTGGGGGTTSYSGSTKLMVVTESGTTQQGATAAASTTSKGKGRRDRGNTPSRSRSRSRSRSESGGRSRSESGSGSRGRSRSRSRSRSGSGSRSRSRSRSASRESDRSGSRSKSRSRSRGSGSGSGSGSRTGSKTGSKSSNTKHSEANQKKKAAESQNEALPQSVKDAFRYFREHKEFHVTPPEVKRRERGSSEERRGGRHRSRSSSVERKVRDYYNVDDGSSRKRSYVIVSFGHPEVNGELLPFRPICKMYTNRLGQLAVKKSEIDRLEGITFKDGKYVLQKECHHAADNKLGVFLIYPKSNEADVRLLRYFDRYAKLKTIGLSSWDEKKRKFTKTIRFDKLPKMYEEQGKNKN